MILWIVLTSMIVIAAVGLTLPLVRRHDQRRHEQPAAVLKDELSAIAVDRTGVLSANADSLRADLGRRLLAVSADPATPRSTARPISGRGLIMLGVGLAAAVGLGATTLYSHLGRPDLATAQATLAAAPAEETAIPAHQGMNAAALVAELEARVRQNPDDADGWRMLGWSDMKTGRYGDAATAYGRASALVPASGEFLSAEGEALAQAAGGEVTPSAEKAFRGSLVRDADDPRARFYLALATYQHGDHQSAMKAWVALLKSAPPNAPWAADVRSAVARIASRDGEDVDAISPAGGDPSPNEVAAVQRESPAARAAMIQQMVDGLAARLKTNPRDPDGWIRLMRARMVLGDPATAAAAYREARTAYADSDAQQAAFMTAARSLKIPGV